jgi:DNA polymerase
MTKPDDCNGCPLLSAPGPVTGEGPLDAILCEVGEAPARDEIELGRPFVGGAGRVLNALNGQAGIDRPSIRIENVIRCRVPNDDLGGYEHAAAAIRHCSEAFLKPQLRSMPTLRVIVALGNSANWCLTERGEHNEGIQQYRGYPHDPIVFGGATILPTIHPAAIMRVRTLWSVVVADLRKALRIAQHGWYPPPEVFNFQPTPSDVEAFVETIIAAKAPIVVDIENPGNVLEVIGFATAGGYSISIPFFNANGDRYWTPPDELEVLGYIYRLLACEAVPKIVHFEQHERFWLTQYGFELRGPVWDTHVMHAMVYPPFPHDLGFVTSVHTDRICWKPMVNWSKGEVEEEK